MNPRLISRQSFVSTATSAAVVVVLPRTSLFEPAAPAGIRLKSRPGKPKLSIAPGLHRQMIGLSVRDSWIHIPRSLDPKKPEPLLLALHGATQDHAVMTSHLAAFSETMSAAIALTSSR